MPTTIAVPSLMESDPQHKDADSADVQNEVAESVGERVPGDLTDCNDGSTRLTQEELQQAIDVLERVLQDRGQLLELDRDQQTRLLRVAGQVAHPGRAARRQLVRASRNQRRQELEQLKQRDEQLLNKTGIRQRDPQRKRLAHNAPPHPEPATAPEPDDSPAHGKLEHARNCYICKTDFQQLHFFYDSLCPECADFNWEKRNQTADLRGRTALVTGGRVKIGFETALKMLRAGADVVVTTRFPRDAARRFSELEDSCDWSGRLTIYGLDMRHLPSVEALALHLQKSLPRLDAILNNACQTVRRPPGFYRHLMDGEQKHAARLTEQEHDWLAQHDRLSRQTAMRPVEPQVVLGESLSTLSTPALHKDLVGLAAAPELSQLALVDDDHLGDATFPSGQYDGDQQQVDLREKNSWRLRLAEVSTIELLEVHLVNAVAPFIFNARLKERMKRSGDEATYIVNVSAMEGVFYRAFKRDTHPHTNMAKAALNMMTRTSAIDYARDQIYMNSVDTGWITDEDPIEITRRKEVERGFSTPLDSIDAAARICDPVFDGVNNHTVVWGKFLKDYQVSNW